jgi:hypothetical protein
MLKELVVASEIKKYKIQNLKDVRLKFYALFVYLVNDACI